MNTNKRYLLRRMLNDERGQVLPIVALLLVSLVGMAGLVVDLGHAFYARRELQDSTDAAALAGAESLPASTATTVALQYSAVAGNLNAHSNLSGVTMVSGYPLLRCLTTLKNQGMPCVAPTNANAITVKQQITIPTYFAGIFGTKSVTISAVSTVAMRGASTSPYNVAIIVDTTASMASADSDCGNKSRLTCALQGVQVLLSELAPCASSEASCGTVTQGMVANSVDRVSLFTFPNVTVGTAGQEYDCSSSNPTVPVYSLPSATGTTYNPTGSTTATYQILGFSSDYRTSDTSSTLNNSSNLSLAIGAKSGCTGMGAPGGDGTYYAGVIYAAQAALVAEQAANPGSQNVIIMLSDGDASAAQNKMASTATSSGTYPSYNNQCHQAVTAAQAATAAGTRFYSVAYGSGSSGCSTDNPAITPCQTMENMASAPQYFFSDYTATGSGGCTSAAQPTSNLSQIFTEIASDFTVARIIPDNTP